MLNVRTISLLLLILLTGIPGGMHAAADDAEDTSTDWKLWKSIESAIELRPLDGPDDIIEKAEIIEDRADDLQREKQRLQTEAQPHEQKLQALTNQHEVLKDLAEIRLGGDAQTRQRLQELAGRIRREESQLKEIQHSISELNMELVRINELFTAYREKARLLRLEEGGSQ